MKTPMQELRNDILIEMQLGIIGEHSGNRVLHYIDSLYLEKEKIQIIDAYKEGMDYTTDNDIKIAIKYYKETYNNEI